MSKTLNLAIAVDEVNLNPDDKQRHPAEIVTTVCRNVILTWANGKRGLSGIERKQYYAISDAFEKAVKDKADSVELEDRDMGMLRTAFREAVITPDALLRKVEGLVDAVKDR